jgi:hypothetical protein
MERGCVNWTWLELTQDPDPIQWWKLALTVLRVHVLVPENWLFTLWWY